MGDVAWWRKPIPEGEPNPLSMAILRSFRRFVLAVIMLYLGAGLAHEAWRLILAGWERG